jgi:hypothetical protein
MQAGLITLVYSIFNIKRDKLEFNSDGIFQNKQKIIDWSEGVSLQLGTPSQIVDNVSKCTLSLRGLNKHQVQAVEKIINYHKTRFTNNGNTSLQSHR